MILQHTSPAAAHQFIARNSKSSPSLTVELLSNLLSRQLKNRCRLYGAVSIPCVRNMNPIPSMRSQQCLVQERPKEAGELLRGMGM